jgi:hypothetical protein
MNEPLDALERELMALQPIAPSPRLEEQLARSLKGEPRSVLSRRARWLIALAAAGAVAASFVAIVFRHNALPETPEQGPQVVVRPAIASSQSDSSLWFYRQALARSAGDFEAALARHPEPISTGSDASVLHVPTAGDVYYLNSGDL